MNRIMFPNKDLVQKKNTTPTTMSGKMAYVYFAVCSTLSDKMAYVYFAVSSVL